MFGFNKKYAKVLWRHPRFRKVSILEIAEYKPIYAVAYIDLDVEALKGEFTDNCVHAYDCINGDLKSCEIFARSFNYLAMELIAKNIDKFGVTNFTVLPD